MAKKKETSGSPSRGSRLGGVFLGLICLVSAAPVVGEPQAMDRLSTEAPAVPSGFTWRELEPTSPASPELPTNSEFPVQLVYDDDSAEGAFGVGGATSRQFLWFQSFQAPTADFELEEAWVLFPQDPEISAGAAIQLVIYTDPDRDPTNGAELLAAVDTTVQVADGDTFSIYPLDPPLPVRGSDDVLIGVVSRFVVDSVTPPIQPAALDTDESRGGAWVATWTGTPPDPPELPPDQSLFLVDDIVPGNWMIRGFGNVTPVVEVPALSRLGLGLSALLLAFTAAVLLRRKP